MRRLLSLLVLGVLAAAAGTFVGCNEDLDDPTLSEGVLTVESVNPVLIQSDLQVNDPNNPDTTTITLKNRPRNPSADEFSDIYVSSTKHGCSDADPAGTVSFSGTGIANGVVPSGGTADFTVIAVTEVEKAYASPGDTWVCYVQFFGEDVAGNPAESDAAQFAINFQ